MKKSIMFIICMLSGLIVSAQNPIKDQPGQAYFDRLEKIIIEKAMPEKDFLALKSSPIPDNFMDTLKKYDWVYAGGYTYVEKYYTDYKKFYKEYKIMRFDENGGKLEFSINGYQNFVVNHFNSKNPPHSNWSVVKANNNSYILNTTATEKGYQKILSYHNGTFIFLITKSGKMNDNAVAFREYYTAVPKVFKWEFNE